MPIVSESIAAVETTGSFDDALRLNLYLRTGHRVLLQLKAFRAQNADELYRQIFQMPWEETISDEGFVCITSSVENRSIRDTRFASLKCKDAIVDRIKDKTGRRPDSGPMRDHTVINLYWKEDRCIVHLDTSGEPLSHRGYRKIPMDAPMQETLAAAVVLATGWNGDDNVIRNFINPMCGSGTLAIEAALVRLNHAPGLLRNNFGFMHTKHFQAQRWSELQQIAMGEVKKSFPGRIIATDINPQAIRAARKNATTAGVEHIIEFNACDFADTQIPEGGGIVVMNPEYGDRMGEVERLEQTYEQIGNFFKHNCRGYTGYVFTGNPTLAKKVGLRHRKSRQFFNSSIECRLLEYELYEGSKKGKKA